MLTHFVFECKHSEIHSGTFNKSNKVWILRFETTVLAVSYV